MGINTIDSSYWRQVHPHPLAPNTRDVEHYRSAISGRAKVLLLGNTPALIPLSTVALDLEPFDTSGVAIKGDWVKNTQFFDAIIGDGVLNFTPELAHGVVSMAREKSSVFIARVFRKKLPIMKVAAYFPSPEDCEVPPTTVIDFGDYSFYIWQNTQP